MPSYVIVGASRGLGYEWLRQLSQDPANTVIGIVRSVDTVQNKLTTDSLTNIHLISGDMTSLPSLLAASLSISKLTPSIDYLIINGAYISLHTAQYHPSDYTTRAALLREEMIRCLDVNVIGVIHSINAFLPLVRKSNIKKITMISSGMADLEWVTKNDIPGSVIYASMKAAANLVVAKYAVELKGEGVLVFAISPGIVDTNEGEMTEDVLKGIMKLIPKVQAAHPGWKGPATAEESILAQKSVIEKVGLEESGSFLSHKGSKVWL